jgi:hypothetical protein
MVRGANRIAWVCVGDEQARPDDTLCVASSRNESSVQACVPRPSQHAYHDLLHNGLIRDVACRRPA